MFAIPGIVSSALGSASAALGPAATNSILGGIASGVAGSVARAALPSIASGTRTNPYIGGGQQGDQGSVLSGLTGNSVGRNWDGFSSLADDDYSHCPEATCYDTCHQQAKESDAYCKMMNDEHLEEMKAYGCKGAKCSFKSFSQSCRKKRKKATECSKKKTECKKKTACTKTAKTACTRTCCSKKRKKDSCSVAKKVIGFVTSS